MTEYGKLRLVRPRMLRLCAVSILYIVYPVGGCHGSLTSAATVFRNRGETVKRHGEALRKVAADERGLRHFLLRERDHTLGRILPVYAAAVLIEHRGQHICAKADIKHIFLRRG